MACILLHVDHDENRRVLAEWLSAQHRILLPSTPDALDEPFDLCVLDRSALNRLHARVSARKAQEAPLLLPVLLVTPRRTAHLATAHLLQTVDELLTTPIEKVELDARLGVLLRARQLTIDLKLANEARVHHLARFDALTDLPNRTLLQESLNLALSQAKSVRRQVGLLFLDVDRFKTVNESFGYPYGDILLQSLARRLEHCADEGETVARLWGDEFAILVPATGSGSDAAAVAQDILATLATPFSILGNVLYINASIGIAMYPADATDPDGLLRAAETAMYRAKAGGGNSYQFYSENMQQEVRERLVLETALREALRREDFILYYQPQVSLLSGKMMGVEALLRWAHLEHPPISPSRLIPVAEETGLILQLGEWVLRTACAQRKAWVDAGLPVPAISVNLSTRQFNDSTEEMVQGALRQANLDANGLELEITESCIMQDAENAIKTMNNLRRIGVTFSIDDFGTGYSSMSYLRRLPVSTLKIDQSFVRDLESDEDSQLIVTAIINLAHSLKLGVVAEGVESAGQVEYLRAHGCDAAQGFYFSRPLSADDFARFGRGDFR